MSVELKIKIKNLADEARTIRKEEQKLHGMEKWKLQHHRKTVVRDAARRSLIAYMKIRGKEWEQHALKRDDCVMIARDNKEVERMVRKYGERVEELQQEDTLSVRSPDVLRGDVAGMGSVAGPCGRGNA